MLQTPFGEVKLLLDGREVPFETVTAVIKRNICPDISGAFRLHWRYVPDGKAHALRCILCNASARACSEGGERLEMVSFYMDGGKLSIGVEGDFCDPPVFAYDYSGCDRPDGVELFLTPQTGARDFVFGVAWLEDCSKEREIQTWFAADPTI